MSVVKVPINSQTMRRGAVPIEVSNAGSMVLKASAAVKRIEGSDGKGIVEGDMIVRVNGAAVTGGNDANRALRLAFKDQVVEEVVLTLMHLPDGHVAAAAGIDEPDVGQQVTSNFVQRVKASMNGVVKASEMVNFQRVCYRLYNGSSGSNMKHMCSALGIDVGTPAYMKMAIEIRLRDLQFSEWDVFVPTADDWQLRESDDEVHEKLLDITYTIAQMKGQLQSLVMHRTAGSQGAAQS